MVPLYWRHLSHVHPFENVLHRILWSAVLLALLLAKEKKIPQALAVLSSKALLKTLSATTLLIGANWLMFIWAVNSGRLLETSLGYFMTPLINILLGAFFLNERLTRGEKAAVFLAAAGVANLLAAHGAFPWLALALAASFGFYGLLRKLAPVDAMVGLAVETMLLAVPSLGALLYLGFLGRLHFLTETRTDLLLMGTSVITTLPLLWFNIAARKLELKTIAFAQYLSPTCHFILAVTLFHEPLRTAQAVTFILIWLALAIYTWGHLRRRYPPVI